MSAFHHKCAYCVVFPGQNVICAVQTATHLVCTVLQMPMGQQGRNG